MIEFINESQYQQIVHDMLTMARKMGASAAEVGLSSAVGLNVTVRLNEIETLEFNRDKSIAVTVYKGDRKGTASTTDISPASLQATVLAALNLAKLMEPDPFAGLALMSDMATEKLDLDLYYPWDLTVDNAVRIAKACEQSALDIDQRMKSDGATLNSAQGYHVYGNTHGFLGYYPTSKHSLSCVMIAQEANAMERDYEYTLSRKPDLLESPEKIGRAASHRALNRLAARKLPTQKTPVLFHADIAAGIISHFLAAISGGRLFRKSSFLLDSLGKSVFPPHMHIYERPHILGGLGSAPFDSDGVKTQDKDIVDKGVVKSYLLSAYSARKLNLQNTGNAGGAHNILVKSTGEDYAALIKKLDRGLVVTELMGPGINLVTGDYSRGAAGFWVENGKVQYPVHEITIAGNLAQMFKQLIAVGNDVEKRSSIQTGSLLIEEMTLAGS